MAKNDAAKATKKAPVAEFKSGTNKTAGGGNRTEGAVEEHARVNPYKDHPLHIPGLLRAILCEIWELRQDIRSK